MTLLPDELLSTADNLAEHLYAVLELPRCEDTSRTKVSHLSTQLALEHWDACRALLALGAVPSGMVVLRAQYEATVRAVWVLYAASDVQVAKLSAVLAVESEQDAKNLPLVADMMSSLSSEAPPPAFDALFRFKDSAWKALNSYVHAGLHPLQRQAKGYPLELVDQIFRISNALAIVAGMQGAALAGN